MSSTQMIRRDLTLAQGKYWEWAMRLFDGGEIIDTATWSARMQIRADYADTGATVILDLTKANGRVETGLIPRDGAPVNVVLTLPHTVDYSAWPLTLGRAMYEVEIMDGGGRVLDVGFYGYATLLREVVR